MEQYQITGMSCAACSARVEKAVGKVPGVTSCSVNLLTNSMGVEGTFKETDVIAAVERAGYGAKRQGSAHTTKKQNIEEDTEIKNRLIVSLIFLVVLMYFSMGHTMWNFPLPRYFESNVVARGLMQMLLSVIVLVINQRFFVSGFRGAMRGSANMDTLVALGSGASFLYSTYALFAMSSAQAVGDSALANMYLHELYFESAAMILVLITVGKLLEARSKGKTTDALKSLVALAPKMAVLLRDGKEEEVPVDSVKKGDVFVVRPGALIPVDGIVVSGSSAINESALTGESIPVDKEKGDSVSAGTINTSGYLVCEATSVGEDTTLSKIIQMVEDASKTKAPIAKIANQVSAIFVPVVIVIALVSFLVWLVLGESFGFSLARGISVLVISCPCALGLATPVAIMVANGIGAKKGILFKTAASLEETGRAKTVVLDKTGTLTKGQMYVTDVIPYDCTEEELLTLAYSLEQKSEHPLANAIIKRAEEQNLTPRETEKFEALPGNGLRAVIEEQIVFGGKHSFIQEHTEIPESLQKQVEALANEGKTPLVFAKENKVLGIIAVADTLKDDSKKAVEELGRMGIRVVLLTGDNERTAKAIAAQVGLDDVIAEVLPHEKERTIRKQKQYGKVIMVGDGINDAPALTTADIGIAIGAGTDVAIDTADVVLMKSNMLDVVNAIRLSRRTLKTIHENLFWAFFYNVIGIPLAAGVFIPLFGLKLSPMFGAAAMSLSSFCVVTNALRLNWIYNRKETIKKEKKKMEKTLNIQGMMCPHCSGRVKTALENIEGVSEAKVSHETGTAVVIMTSDISYEVLKETVEAQGYQVMD